MKSLLLLALGLARTVVLVGVTRMGVASYHPIATMPESTPAA